MNPILANKTECYKTSKWSILKCSLQCPKMPAALNLLWFKYNPKPIPTVAHISLHTVKKKEDGKHIFNISLGNLRKGAISVSSHRTKSPLCSRQILGYLWLADLWVLLGSSCLLSPWTALSLLLAIGHCRSPAKRLLWVCTRESHENYTLENWISKAQLIPQRKPKVKQ